MSSTTIALLGCSTGIFFIELVLGVFGVRLTDFHYGALIFACGLLAGGFASLIFDDILGA